jgi:uncharacterized protein DUF6079
MSKWLQEKQLTAYEVTYQGKTKTLQQWTKGISLRDKARLGPDDRINFRDVVNVVSGLALAPFFQERAPEYPAFAMLLTHANRGHMIGSALKALATGSSPKDAIAVLDALELLDGSHVDPTRSRYAQDVLSRLKAKGHGQVLNRSELLSGGEIEYFSPAKSRLEPDLLVAVLGGLVYSGDIVLSITGDKVDSSKLTLLADRPLDEPTSFKHIEAPKEINLPVLRALFELLGKPTGLAQQTVAGGEAADNAIKTLQEAVDSLLKRVLAVGKDMGARLSFWGQPLLRTEEVGDWRGKLHALKSFTETLSPYNTAGKLKNLRIGLEDMEAQRRNLDVLANVERMLELVNELGPTASYLSSAELVLKPYAPWVAEAREARKKVLDKLGQDRAAEHLADCRKTLARLKKDYITPTPTSTAGRASTWAARRPRRPCGRTGASLPCARSLASTSCRPASSQASRRSSTSSRAARSWSRPTSRQARSARTAVSAPRASRVSCCRQRARSNSSTPSWTGSWRSG